MQKRLAGVSPRARRDGRIDYRASVTYRKKHIALGSYRRDADAHLAYLTARRILDTPAWTLAQFRAQDLLPFDKCVSLTNFRDNGIYFPNPIYLMRRYFLYYLEPELALKFDTEDLFFYAAHRIMRRGGHLFVSLYDSQISLLSRYGIRSYAVQGRDYRFANGDAADLRYENILILNRYHGVRQYASHGFQRYRTVIRIQGSVVVGHYDTEAEAAVAYNKAADLLHKRGLRRNFRVNYLEELSAPQYAELYRRIRISPRILNYRAPEGL